MSIVCKFGGTSLASADNVRRCAEIVKSDSRRRYVVASAPGKKTPESKKVTDLLLNLGLYRHLRPIFHRA